MADRQPRAVPGTKVVLLTPERMLDRASRRFLAVRPSACIKCGSVFVDHEPAFVHCRYCGCIARLANRSLLEQEAFEMRSGLRVAS